MMDGLGLHFLVDHNFYTVIPGAIAIQDVLKVFVKRKLGVETSFWKFNLRTDFFNVSPYNFRLSSDIVTSLDLENMTTLVFSGLSSILYLAQHTAKFRRSFCESFAAKCMFLLIAHNAVSLANWGFESCLW